MNLKKLDLKMAVSCAAALGLSYVPTASIANGHHMVNEPMLNGSASFNYVWNDTGANKKRDSHKLGQWTYDQFRLNFQGSADDIKYQVENGWFDGYRHLLETSVSYNFSNQITGQLGNLRQPFGVHDESRGPSWWGGMDFYTGFADTHNTGLKVMYSNEPWALKVLLGKNSLVSANNANSWTPKLTTGTAAAGTGVATANGNNDVRNEDNTQLVGKLTYTHDLNSKCNMEFGVSARYGKVYNQGSEKNGHHSAGAAHVSANWEKLNVMLQYLPYRYSVKNGDGVATGTVQLGKDGNRYTMPSKANIWSASASYAIPVNWGKIDTVTVYDEFSNLSGKDTVSKSNMNVLGASFNAGPLYVSADFVTGKNMYGIGEETNVTHNIGANNGDNNDITNHRKSKFNVNVGVQF